MLEKTSAYLPAIDQFIAAYFDEFIEKAEKIDPSYAHLWKNLKSLMQSGGKRLRPQMTMLGYEAYGGQKPDKVLPIAAAQEMLHFSLLIHDDIIDRDYVRHGVPNIAGRYKSRYEQLVSDPAECTHYAQSAAILGGDLMLSAAYHLIANSSVSAKQKVMAQTMLAHTMFEVAGGELLDTEASFVPPSTSDALKIARYKTASYSFINPLLTGSSLASASSGQKKLLSTYGQSLGIAYQLVDDLLGIFGSEEQTGKSIISDIREGKRTFMIERVTENMSRKDRAFFGMILGNRDATPEAVLQAKDLLIKYGVREITQQAVAQYIDTAQYTVRKLDIASKHQKMFEVLIERITDRAS